ncbi:hypothetical protein FISHEDRAFT_78345 [Fistulina hepatica ATCC 64428]|nr:hypothetical protein FISHEDRAFT_78345 [Fistulina hepatica ATCC 64428]
MSSTELSEFQQAVVETCSKPIEYAFSNPDLRGIMFDQANTQKYVYDQTTHDPSAPRVPKIYECFTYDWMTYLVMELLQATSIREWVEATPDQRDERWAASYKEVAKALNWLRRLPPPPGAGIGPVGGGYARHRLFKDRKAPLKFSSNRALEIYVNKSYKWIPRGYEPPEIQISHEPLVFTQSDMHETNFLVDDKERVCIIDFGDIGLLPESFASFTVHSIGSPFVQGVAGYLGWQVTPNLASMHRAAGILIMIANPTLGLDKDGNKADTDW